VPINKLDRISCCDDELLGIEMNEFLISLCLSSNKDGRERLTFFIKRHNRKWTDVDRTRLYTKRRKKNEF